MKRHPSSLFSRSKITASPVLIILDSMVVCCCGGGACGDETFAASGVFSLGKSHAGLGYTDSRERERERGERIVLGNDFERKRGGKEKLEEG